MLTPRREKQLQDFQSKIRVTFLNPDLLNQSLTHSSFAHESRNKSPDNERLELLGDAVIKLITTEYLYNKFPDHQEGDITKIRAVAISDDILAAKEHLLACLFEIFFQCPYPIPWILVEKPCGHIKSGPSPGFH